MLLPETNIGMIGHVDHGKTTLTHALTGKWTMSHSEELKRGITIKLGYADCDIRQCVKCRAYTIEKICPKCGSETKIVRRISFVDAPGHETLMAVMISGAALMDGAILVIAANEPCPQPQTQEHLIALKILGIKKIIVVQNKIDLVSKEQALKNYKQIKEFVKATLGFETPIIPVSAQKKINIDALVEAMQEYLPTPQRDLSKDPLMYVARSFDINKPGTPIEKLIGGVIGGAIAQGKFKVGDEIELRPGRRVERKGQVSWEPIKTKIVSIACGGTLVKEKGPGGTVAFSTTLDPTMTKSDALVGNVVGLIGKLPNVYHALDLDVELFDWVVGAREKLPIEPLKVNEPLMLSIGTATTLGVVRALGKRTRLILRKPVCARAGDKAAIGRQIQGRWRLIGFGTILS